MPTEQQSKRRPVQPPTAPDSLGGVSCRLDTGTPGVPSCESGPLGRLRFVVRELHDLWSQRQREETL